MAIRGRSVPQKPKLGPYVLNSGLIGVSTPNYAGTVVLAGRKGVNPRQKPLVVVQPPVIGSAVPGVSLPRYMGLNVRARQRSISRTRARVTRFRFVPTAGFIGAKTGRLTVQLTRKDTAMTIQPHRQGDLSVQ